MVSVEAPAEQRRPVARTRSLVDRLLSCGTAHRHGTPDAAAQVFGTHPPRSPVQVRRNPHRRSTGQLTAGHAAAIRKTFSVSALSLAVNVKRDGMRWTDGRLWLVVDTLTSAKLVVSNIKKGTVLEEQSIEPGLHQVTSLAIHKPGLYTLKLTSTASMDVGLVGTQRTDLELHKGTSGLLIPRIISQTVQADGGAQYSLLEIYGRPMVPFSASGSVESIEVSEQILQESKECIICLSAARDTIVLPCRHLCLCAECAENLRSRVDKCPICRECCQGLLQIKVAVDAGDDDGECECR